MADKENNKTYYEPFDGEWLIGLRAALERFNRENNEDSYSQLLATLVMAMDDNVSATFAAESAVDEDGSPSLRFVTLTRDGSDENYIVMLTEPSEDFPFTISVKLKKIMMSVIALNGVGGIVINPYGEQFSMDCTELKHLFDLLMAYNYDGNLNQEKKGADAFNLNVKRPMSNAMFEDVITALYYLEDAPYAHVCVGFKNLVKDDEVLFVQAVKMKDNETYHVEIGYDMTSFDMDTLILAKDGMSYHDTVEFFRKVCVDGIPTGDIEELQDFKQIAWGDGTWAKDVKYYYVESKGIIGKIEENQAYIWSAGAWTPDSKREIMDRLMGYDPTEDCWEYRMYNSDIMAEIEEISKEKAMELIREKNQL